MRIVMIEDFFHPEAGYQCNILSRYLTEFGHEVIMVTSEMKKMPEKYKQFFGCDNLSQKDCCFTKKYGVRIIRIPLFKHISGRSIYSPIIYKTVDQLKPDILYVHGNDTYIGIRYILRQNKLSYPIISDNHMVDIASKNRFNKQFKKVYKQIVTPKIIKNNVTVIRTENIDFVNRHYGIPSSQTPYVGFGSDIKLFHEDSNLKLQNRDRLGIPKDAFVCTYAGKLDANKGGLFFAEAIREKLPIENLVFLIVGNTIGEYGKKTETVFSESKNMIIRFPTQKYFDLPLYFQVADITVYPKQCSLSFYDSTVCGAPALVEDNEVGINRSKETGCLTFHAGDSVDFRAKIVQYAKMPKNDFNLIKTNGINYILNNFNYWDQAKKYEELIKQSVTAYKLYK